MQCPTCPDGTVTAFCRECGKGVCPTCKKEVGGVVYCPDCGTQTIDATAEEAAQEASPESAAAETPPPPPPASPQAPRALPPAADETAPHPVLAGILGIVPGLGAVYNGQYVKGLIHVVMFGMLLTIATETARGLEPLFVPLIVLFVLYMPIEAVRTAQAMRRGEEVEEMSGLLRALFRPSESSPALGVALVALGVFLLLLSLGVLDVRALLPGWPVLIIAYGAYRLYQALRSTQSAGREESSERSGSAGGS